MLLRDSVSLAEGETIRCPRCKRDSCLWVAATQSGWMNLDPTGKIELRSFEKDCEDPEPDQWNETYGCGECSYESSSIKDFAVRLDADGNDLPQPIPGQISIDEVQ